MASSFFSIPRPTLLALAVGAAGISGACGGSTLDTSGSGGSAAGGGSGGTGTFVQSSGLPCDVANIVASHCLSCHGTKPAKGVPMSLTSLASFKAPSVSDASKSNGEMSVIRMSDTKFPMPPTGALSAADIQTFAAWVNAGMPAGTCDGGTGGAGGAAGAGGGPPPTPVSCDPSQQWYGGNEGSTHMKPGEACIACHKTSFEAPSFTIAGTVYPDPHLVDDCNGTNTSAGLLKVEITDSNGQSFTINVNTVGNFFSQIPVAFPISAKVVDTSSNAERAMKQTVPSGDCNSCHTWDGANGAPGRITAP